MAGFTFNLNFTIKSLGGEGCGGHLRLTYIPSPLGSPIAGPSHLLGLAEGVGLEHLLLGQGHVRADVDHAGLDVRGLCRGGGGGNGCGAQRRLGLGAGARWGGMEEVGAGAGRGQGRWGGV